MQELINSIAALSWPILALTALLMFRRPLSRVIQSAERRQFTLRIGGQELDMRQLSEQQDGMIADLQTQLSRLRQEVAALTSAATGTPDPVPAIPDADDGPTPPPWGQPQPGGPPGGLPPIPQHGAAQPYGPPGEYSPQPTASTVLWVDDRPQNNALVIDRLERNGIRVDIAKTTDEALALIEKCRYGAILTDMGRTEDGVRAPDAGLHLIEAVRARGLSVPIIVYSSSRGTARSTRDRALLAGATLVTGSTIDLTAELAILGLLPG